MALPTRASETAHLQVMNRISPPISRLDHLAELSQKQLKETQLVCPEYLQAEFDKRGWMLACQCSQTPAVNVQDACVFPSLSKSQSKAQAMA